MASGSPPRRAILESERGLRHNTIETVVTCCVEVTSGSLSPCGRGPGRGGQGSTNRLVRGRGQASSPLSLPSPARGEGELNTGHPLGYSYFNGIGPYPSRTGGRGPPVPSA